MSQDRPLCEHGSHDDGTPWCAAARESLCNRLQMVRIRLGTDFETHGGKKVMFIGSPDLAYSSWQDNPPYGTIGTIESTWKNDGRGPTVNARWDYTPDPPMRGTYHSWPWEYVEILKTDEEGNILPGEIERARLKTVPRVLSLALPCPICGWKGVQMVAEHGYWSVWCSGDCGVAGPRISDQFPALMAISVWNIRGVPEALTKEVRGFPDGDVQHFLTIETHDLPESPCPWCMGTRIKIWKDSGSKMYHGQCEGCGVFTPWWPGRISHPNYSEIERATGSPEAVIEGWKRRLTQKR